MNQVERLEGSFYLGCALAPHLSSASFCALFLPSPAATSSSLSSHSWPRTRATYIRIRILRVSLHTNSTAGEQSFRHKHRSTPVLATHPINLRHNVSIEVILILVVFRLVCAAVPSNHCTVILIAWLLAVCSQWTRISTMPFVFMTPMLQLKRGPKCYQYESQ